MARSVATVAVGLVMAGCALGARTPPAGAQEVTAVADEYLAARLRSFPESQTYLGLPGVRHDRLTDNSLLALAAWRAREDALHERLRRVDPASLAGSPERLMHATLLETLASSRARRVCRDELWPVNQLDGWHADLPYLASIQPVGTPEAREQALTRARAIPRYVDTEIANLREGVRLGYTLPRPAVERVIAQLEGLLVADPTASPFHSPAQRDSTPGFGPALAAVIRDEITPAGRRYLDFLRTEYLPRARETIAVAALPEGEACYRARLRAATTLELTPREVHELGLREMERIQAEMGEIARRSFGTSDVAALLVRLRDDPRYRFRTREEIMTAAREAVERGKAEMPKWFGILPRADVRVEPYAEFEEASQPLGAYFDPAEDGSRPGIYRINTYQADQQPRAPIQSTAFHEAIPGHHLQVAIAQELAGSHPVQRFLFNGAYVEGWALYAERLADEMGLFSTDLDRMGLLSNEALRAARLVVDPGMHALGWTRQQAIDYMLRHTAESEGAVATEVDRYIVWPGQATAYMVGRNEILRLREEARRALGPRFDIRDFHDQVLGAGSVPLPVLRERIEGWVAEKQ